MGLAAAPKEDRSIIDAVLRTFRAWCDCSTGGGARCRAASSNCWRWPVASARPKLILLDEPTEGIQPSIIEEIIETLLALKKRWNMSLIVVEQNLEFITSLSDRVLNIQKGASRKSSTGKVFWHGTPPCIQPSFEFRRGYPAPSQSLISAAAKLVVTRRDASCPSNARMPKTSPNSLQACT